MSEQAQCAAHGASEFLELLLGVGGVGAGGIGDAAADVVVKEAEGDFVQGAAGRPCGRRIPVPGCVVRGLGGGRAGWRE